VKYKKKHNELKINFLKVDYLNTTFVILLAVVLFYFFVSNSILKYLFLKKQLKVLKTQLLQIKQENKKLEEEIYLLQTDTDTIEYYIRKELNYKKPNEKVLIIK
jgi:cell division protein FtsB